MPATYGIVTAGTFQSQGVAMIRGGDIKGGQIAAGLPLVAEEIHAQYKRTALQEDDVVIALVGYPGEAAVVPKRLVGANISRAVGLLRVVDSLDPAFLATYLNSSYGRATVLKPSAGSAQIVVNLKYLNEILVPCPKPAEQQKIAECLSTLDELIGAESQKLDALKAHKKGLMQQLFPREGETIPRLRFPEFESEPEWELCRIQDLIDKGFIIGHLDGNHGELYPQAEEFSNSGVPYISANDFVEGFVDFKRCRYLPERRALKFKKGVAKDGDILFAHNATVGPVAKLSTSLKFVILSTTATYFRCDLACLVNDFLKCVLTSPAFVNQYSRVMAQSTRNQIPITAQRRFFLQVPSYQEQQRIASCLSSLEELIAAQSDKLQTLKTHKKGLMQQLFPSPAEA
jgi:type I restriction enzyme, S subunit